MNSALQAAALGEGLNGLAGWWVKVRQVNRYYGTNFTPWELMMQVPVDWTDAMDLVMGGLPKVQNWTNDLAAATEDLKRRTSRNRFQ